MQSTEPPPPHISPPGMWTSKLALRILQFILAISLIGYGGAMVGTSRWSILSFVTIAPQAVVSAIWALSEGICLLARRGHRGIHPGANVALDLLLWLGFVAGLVLLGFVSVDSYYGDIYGGIDPRSRALMGLGATLTIAHFTTFVIACVETNQRNRGRPVVYVATAPYAQYPQQMYPRQMYAPQYGQGGQQIMYAPVPQQQAYQQPGVKA